MKYFNYHDEVMNHFNSLEVGTLAFCFGNSVNGDAYSNLAYYRIIDKIDNDCMCLLIHVQNEDPNEPDDHRRYFFHPMQVYPVEGLE